MAAPYLRNRKVLHWHDLRSAVPHLPLRVPIELSNAKLVDIFNKIKVMFADFVRELHWNDSINSTAVKANRHEINVFYEKLIDRANHLRDASLLAHAEEEENASIANFWENFSASILVVFEWLRHMFNVMLHKQESGFIVDKKLLKDAYGEIATTLDSCVYIPASLKEKESCQH